ncbi:MAG: ABC transporter substrate-binding protein [Magnetococcales bacterium]|nr:ABC transporter substrate-binding protein [Magnetococcales bacterium]
MVLALSWFFGCTQEPKKPVKIGILHSLTGTMAASEQPLVDAMTLAIEEINHAGGILGRPLQTVVADTQSDPHTAAQAAERLIVEEQVAALFGCWTSACRLEVKAVVERRQHLLFYPLQYEGMERSSHIIYTGATPNQQIIPALLWAMEQLGPRLYLIGSDYLFPHAANRLIRTLAPSQGGKIVAERYLPMGSGQVEPIITEISTLQPDVVLNTINGDSNVAFFNALEQANRNAVKPVAVLSFSIAEVELAQHPGLMQGHYAAWGYFQSIDSPRNRAFIHRFRSRFGQNRVLDDPMEAAYVGVHLWAQGVNDAQTIAPDRVSRAVLHQSLQAPQGIVSLDAATRHLWRTVRIGRAQADGQFALLWSSERPVRPSPFPAWLDKPRADTQPVP